MISLPTGRHGGICLTTALTACTKPSDVDCAAVASTSSTSDCRSAVVRLVLAAAYTRSSARLKLATVACWPTRRWMAASYTKRSMRQVDSMLAAAGVYQCGQVGMVACLCKRICPIQSQLEWQRLRRSKVSSGQYSGLHLLETILLALVANVVEWSFAILKRVEDGVTSDSLLWQWCSRHAQSTVCQRLNPRPITAFVTMAHYPPNSALTMAPSAHAPRPCLSTALPSPITRPTKVDTTRHQSIGK